MNPLISPSEASSIIQDAVSILPQIHCPIDLCIGRILREPIQADRPFPPFNRSMMDGYAVKVTDLDKKDPLIISGQAWAGAPQLSLDKVNRSCIEIMTGAVVPKYADCVIPYEETAIEKNGTVRILEPSEHQPGDCVHKRGSDLDTSATLVEPGRTLRSHEMALAATCGYSSLSVTQLPQIAIVSTGDELVPIKQTPLNHQIRRSNDIAIATTLTRFGTPAGERVHLSDDPIESKEELTHLINRCQILIISGGISMGKKDFIPDVLSELGFKCGFHGVRQKPGKPMGFWTKNNHLVFTLPGNPLSTLACLHTYVLPALTSALGCIEHTTAQIVRLSEPFKGRDDLTVLLPVKLLEGHVVAPLPANNSGDLITISDSHGYILLPPKSSKHTCEEDYSFIRWH